MTPGRDRKATMLGCPITLEALPDETAELFADLLCAPADASRGVELDGDGAAADVLAQLTGPSS